MKKAGKSGGMRKRVNFLAAIVAASVLSADAQMPDINAVANISGMTGMEYVALGGGAAPKELVETKPENGEAAKWFECADDPAWFTNSFGAKISVERYCAIVNVEGGQVAAENFNEKYKRCNMEKTISLAERTFGAKCRGGDDGKAVLDSGDEIAYQAWKLGDELYLLLVEDDTGRMKMRSYVYCLDDGKTSRRLVVFDYEPGARQVESVVAARTNPSALNNVAAMIYNEEASRGVVADEYIVKLLEMAALGGEPAACRNLAYYYGKKKKTERSDVWAKLAGTLARRRSQRAKLRLERRPLSEWPHVLGDKP